MNKQKSLNIRIITKQNMGRTSKIINIIIIFLFSTALVNAFGYFRKDYDIFDFMGMSGMGFFMGFGLVVLAAVLFLFVFWLWMLVDCLKRDFKKDYEKIVWILVLIFLHLLGAIIYYFVVKVASKNVAAAKKK